MTYRDLPDDIRSHALTEGPIRGDVVDLILSIEERRAGALGIMVCDNDDCGVQPLVLGDLPADAGTGPLVEVLDLLLPMVGEEHGAVLIGRGRRQSTVPTDDDRAWHQAALDACTRHRVRLLGFYLATPSGVEELPQPLAATS
jgi:hypothetical protein